MKQKIIVGLCALVIIVTICLYKLLKNDDKDYNFRIYFFNVGKADAILFSSSEINILIDTGEEETSSVILSYLKNNNITKLDYLIITHFDKDHIGGAANIIRNIEVENVCQSNVPKESEYYDEYLAALSEEDITAQTISGNVEISLNDIDMIINGPTEVYDSNESNNSSLIVSVNYKNTNYLFMGDSQNDRIKDYLNNNEIDSYDLIKIPYHGNYQKKLDDLLDETNPQYGVITCSNTEPDTEETEDLLSEKGVKTYLTKNGGITVLSDGDNIEIKQ